MNKIEHGKNDIGKRFILSGVEKHDTHIKLKSYKYPGLVGGPGFESSLCNLSLICLFESL